MYSQRAQTRIIASHPPDKRFVMMLRAAAILLVMLAGAVAGASAKADQPQVRRGHNFAQTNCAQCHAIGQTGESPLAKAPPFRSLHLRYEVEDLSEALAEGIRTAHREMPQFELDVGQIQDLIAYLKSLERSPG